MTSSPSTQRQPGWQMVLVPDLGAQLLAPLAVLEEFLTDLAVWEAEDAADPFSAGQGLWLPAPLAGRVALAAVWRLRAALTPSQFLGRECGRLCDPEADECPPLRVVKLGVGDVVVLSATAGALGHPGLDADVATLLDTYAQQDGHPCGREDRAGFIARLAAIAGLPDLAPTEHSRLLLPAWPPTGRSGTRPGPGPSRPPTPTPSSA